MNYLKQLVALGGKVKQKKLDASNKLNIPIELYEFISTYKFNLTFKNSIIYKPKYKTHFEGERGELSLGELYGLEPEGIDLHTQKLSYHIDNDKCLFYALGDDFCGNYICYYVPDGGIYFFLHDNIDNFPIKIFDSLDDFICALYIETPFNEDKQWVSKAKVTLDF